MAGHGERAAASTGRLLLNPPVSRSRQLELSSGPLMSRACSPGGPFVLWVRPIGHTARGQDKREMT
jgi:hypothetical protein